jgi:hypothetical protein
MGVSMPSDNEIVNLIKSAAQEGQFDKMSTKEMEKVYNHGYKLTQNKPYDEAFIESINRFRDEIERRKNKQSAIEASENNPPDKTKIQKTRKVTAVIFALCAMFIADGFFCNFQLKPEYSTIMGVIVAISTVALTLYFNSFFF